MLNFRCLLRGLKNRRGSYPKNFVSSRYLLGSLFLALMVGLLISGVTACSPTPTPTEIGLEETALSIALTELVQTAEHESNLTATAQAFVDEVMDTPLPETTPTAPQEPTATATLLPTWTETSKPTEVPVQETRDTATPFPTATFTEVIGSGPTRTATATLRWLERRKTATDYPTWTPTASLTPTITLTPTPPFAYLQLAKPGLFSKLISPFRIEAQVAPGEDGMVYVDLVGEDSRYITQLLLNNRANIGKRFWVAPEVDFEISAVAETARLVVFVNDLFGRKIALSSVDLILLLVGENDPNQPINLLEPYVIWYPSKGDVVEGGVVWVGGLVRPVNDLPLIIELIDQNGQVVGSKQILPPQPTGEHTHSRFDVGVPYSVNVTTEVRLTIRQESAGRIPGTVALSSVLITLEP